MYRDRLKAAMRSMTDRKVLNTSSSKVSVIGATRPALPSGYDATEGIADVGFCPEGQPYTS